MYAIIETGGKQYKVEEGQTIRVDKLDVEPGEELTIDKVLLKGGETVQIGAPYVDGAAVQCAVKDHGRGKKIKVFKKWRRNDSRKLQGHRQDYTTLEIKAIH